MTTRIQDKRQKLYEPLLIGGIVVVLAYAAMYLLAESPVLIRVLAPLLGS